MKTKLLLLTLVLTASTLGLRAQEGDPAPAGGRVGPGGPGEARGPQLLPPPVAEQLNLKAEQREQVDKLQAEVKAKMEKILTPEQLEQMKQMRPPVREGGFGGPSPRMGGPGGPNPRMGGPGGPRPPAGAPGMTGGMGGQRPVMPLLEALDLNKDGTIQQEELDKAGQSLKKLDKNGDGNLTGEEFRPPQTDGPGNFQGPGRQGRRGGPAPGGPGAGGVPPPPPPQQ